MRLLRQAQDGSFHLVTFTNGNIPPYAILSHTWGRGEDDEVIYKDVVEGTGKSKEGFKKLQFCSEQASEHDLDHFWIDTCCIDKSSSSELTEAINSMFRWYQQAERCYVYLADVSVRTRDGQLPHAEWASALRNSRWFTRGWTLQELLAPQQVEFYSCDGVRLGDKTSLVEPIHEATGIPQDALRGRSLFKFSVEDRMDWATGRQTTKEEDMAYALLGLCNVFIPLVYGEGHSNAMRRLRKEIADAVAPISNSLEQRPILMPLERNTRFVGREQELSRLEALLVRSDGSTAKAAVIGLGGVGKTQVAIELVYRAKDRHHDCAVFWIPATDPESLLQAYLAMADKLAIPGRDSKDADVKQLVQMHLSNESAGRWLLVFDNADDIGMWTEPPSSGQGAQRLVDYLPRSPHGSILFTTRDRRVAVKLAGRNLVEMPEMKPGPAVELLQKCLVDTDLPRDQNELAALTNQLTNLPLAIVQAAAYINANGTSIADYLLLFAEQDETAIELLSEDFEDDGRYQNIKNPVATTWLISFERIQQHDALAADYLSFMACVEPKDIPQALLPAGPSRKKEIDAIGTLDAYSFITRRVGGGVFDLHRLVHLATQNWLRKNGTINAWADRTIARVADVFPSNNHRNRALWRTYLPHTQYALRLNCGARDNQVYINLTARFGLCLLSDGRYSEAEGPFQEVMETTKRVLGDEHHNTLISMANLASTYRSRGRWTEAEQLFMQVMET